jgi:hypothetical protein
VVGDCDRAGAAELPVGQVVGAEYSSMLVRGVDEVFGKHTAQNRRRGSASRSQGIEVKDRGRIPAELIVKFKAASGN